MCHIYLCFLGECEFLHKKNRRKKRLFKFSIKIVCSNGPIYIYMTMYVCMYVCMYACMYVVGKQFVAILLFAIL